MYRPNKNIVVAAESLPAQYRPSNQARLVRSSAANPGPSDPGAMLPGMGEVRLGNGISSNGLLSGGAERRLARALVDLRAKQAERDRQVQATGSPNALSRPKMTVPLAQALQAIPAAPSPSDAPDWEHVDTVLRPRTGTRWIITRIKTPSAWRYAVTLYRRRGEAEDQIVRSDNLANERSAREYIRAYEVRHGDLAQVGAPKKVSFWAGILRRGGDDRRPSPRSVAAVRSAVSRETRASVNGLGELAVQPLVLGALAIGTLFFIHKIKRA